MLKIALDTLESSSASYCTCSISISMNSTFARMKLRLDMNKYLQASIYSFAETGTCYEPDYTSLMMTVLRPGDTVIDVGANFGYFSLLASSLVADSGKVIALEPEKDNFAYLTRNIQLNNASNMRALNVAAGDSQKQSKLHIDPLNDGGHSLGGISPESIQQLGNTDVIVSDVQVVTLDGLIESESITDIKLIKIDTEGWEFHTIQGALAAVKRFAPPFILAEVNRTGLRRAGASEKYLRMLLAELGYSTFAATCLANSKLVLELIPKDYYAEPEREHYNYNAVFARPEALAELSSCYYIFG